MGASHAHERSGHNGGAAEGADRVEVVHCCGGLVRTGSEFLECGAVVES